MNAIWSAGTTEYTPIVQTPPCVDKTSLNTQVNQIGIMDAELGQSPIQT